MEEDSLGKYNNIKQLSVSMAVYSSTSILGPLLVIGGAGYYLDKLLKTGHWFLWIGVFVAFIVTNILLFQKMAVLGKLISRQAKLKKEKEKIEE